MPKTRYVWDEDNISHETDEEGNVTAAYTYAPKQYGELVSERRDGHAYRHYYDGLGSTIAMTDETGAVTDTFAYDAWGEEIDRTGNTPTPFSWIAKLGYYLDATLHSQSVRRRRYAPDVARWCGVDPFLANRVEISMLDNHVLYSIASSYEYSDNNPLNARDPSGAVTLWDYKLPKTFTYNEYHGQTAL